jgi:UDP-N-acetylglucosamine--N-acetylmuramyl-(pentapeptide) pyrophosphoryl-undecaprenol N-acetylglucosamine transferase
MIIESVIISGGGTGGHIFPAIAIADEIKKRNSSAKILFIGALGKMEMEKVPQAGYSIVGLNISGFQRKFTFSNFLLPFKIFLSLYKARKFLKEFNPQIVIGVGGYASGPTLKMANLMGIKTVIQEQNSFPGKTNRLLSKKASCIFTAYDGMESFFLNSKVILTGNPIRKEFSAKNTSKEEASLYYDLDNKKKTILIIGGSLGAKTLNISVIQNLDKLLNSTIQILWQCGKLYYDQLLKDLEGKKLHNIRLVKFIERMDLAYCTADIIISRAGALSVSELCVIGKPVILVPSPNVAEDHQTKNAISLVEKNAAFMVSDIDAPKKLFNIAFDLLNDADKQTLFSTEIKKLQKINATVDIVNEIEIILTTNE